MLQTGRNLPYEDGAELEGLSGLPQGQRSGRAADQSVVRLELFNSPRDGGAVFNPFSSQNYGVVCGCT